MSNCDNPFYYISTKQSELGGARCMSSSAGSEARPTSLKKIEYVPSTFDIQYSIFAFSKFFKPINLAAPPPRLG
jgi:hypothetical protein